MPTQTSKAKWNGDLKNGNGTMKIGNGSYNGEYTFASRFENGSGTNPEELIGAALAGCFAMALSNELAGAGFTPKSVDAVSDVTFEVNDNGPVITGINLTCKVDVPDIDEDEFLKIAEGAKEGCPVSKALAGTTITLDANLV